MCLGAVAAKALISPSFRITADRGRLLPWPENPDPEDAAVHQAWLLATTHPSAVLRAPEQDREAAYDALVRDLRVAATALG